MKSPIPLLLSALAPVAVAATADAQVPIEAEYESSFEDDYDLTELSLAELMGMEVTIATKTAQKLSEVPAAVYVLTGDEIRRSGHSSIQEALRMVPGFYVSHWTTEKWDVTSRGFGPGLSLTSLAYLNQLLVVIDSVVVYSPLFAGTWWALQDIDLADVDRIEIIRGPGGILWGANAVHGVVHIITKSSAETQGLRLTARGATDDRHTSGRFGGRFGENGTYRTYVKLAGYETLHNSFSPDGIRHYNQDWYMNSAGFRADWSHDGKDYMVWSRGYSGDFGVEAFDLTFFVPYEGVADKKGLQLMGSVSDPESGERLSGSLTINDQNIPTLVDISINTIDLEYQRRLDLDSEVLIGGGYRVVHSDLRGNDPFYLAFTPEDDTHNTYRAFALSHTPLGENAELTLGLTAEHNDFTQFELQPTARATYKASENLMLWTSVSRAVRTPSLEEDSLGGSSVVLGDKDFLSEVLWAYEAGARAMFNDVVSADLAVFYNDYDNLHFEVFDALLGQDLITNQAEGTGHGAELALDVQPTEWWSLRSAYSILRGDYEANGIDIGNEDKSPETTINIRSYIDIGENVEFDAGFYVVDDLGAGFEIAEYSRLDLRLGWTPREGLELFLGVQDLSNDTRSEFDIYDNSRRSFFGGVSWTP